MIGQTPEQCRGKLSDDQTQGPVLDHSTLMSLKISVSWVRMSRVFLEFECWKPEFIRETVWCPCQLSGHHWCCHVYVCDHWLRSPGEIVSAIDWSLVITASLPLTGPSSCQQTDTPSRYRLGCSILRNCQQIYNPRLGQQVPESVNISSRIFFTYLWASCVSVCVPKNPFLLKHQNVNWMFQCQQKMLSIKIALTDNSQTKLRVNTSHNLTSS